MKSIEFSAPFGDEWKTVEVKQPSGGGDWYQIMIDRYYHGTMEYVRGHWVPHLNSKSDLTIDDIQILGALLDESIK